MRKILNQYPADPQIKAPLDFIVENTNKWRSDAEDALVNIYHILSDDNTDDVQAMDDDQVNYDSDSEKGDAAEDFDSLQIECSLRRELKLFRKYSIKSYVSGIL